jgi:TM2 domain-containing membrane protein YozV
MSGLPYSPKSRVVAAVLQFAFGVFGAGRFYTGHIGLALAQLFFSWLTCGIWPIVDGVMMLTGKVKDSEGRPLRE